MWFCCKLCKYVILWNRAHFDQLLKNQNWCYCESQNKWKMNHKRLTKTLSRSGSLVKWEWPSHYSVLVLHLIGKRKGSSFLDQSEQNNTEAMQSQITFDNGKLLKLNDCKYSTRQTHNNITWGWWVIKSNPQLNEKWSVNMTNKQFILHQNCSLVLLRLNLTHKRSVRKFTKNSTIHERFSLLFSPCLPSLPPVLFCPSCWMLDS